MTEENERDRVDALISAAMDDELDRAGRDELAALAAADPAIAARVRAFHQIDSTVRGLGRDELEDERLAASYVSIEKRLGIGAGSRRPLWRHPALHIALAAAAALLLYLALGATPPSSSGPESPSPLAATDGGVEERDSVDAFAVALGYAEGPEGTSPVPGLPMEDFEIIDQLELLEYLAAQEAEGRG